MIFDKELDNILDDIKRECSVLDLNITNTALLLLLAKAIELLARKQKIGF